MYINTSAENTNERKRLIIKIIYFIPFLTTNYQNHFKRKIPNYFNKIFPSNHINDYSPPKIM